MTGVPGTIRRILTATGATALVIASFWIGKDLHAALLFLGAVVWAMANLTLWAVFSNLILRPGEGKGLVLLALGFVKLVLLAAGLVALIQVGTLSRFEVIGLVSGLSLALFISLLMAVGARMTGREMSEGQPSGGRLESSPARELGGEV